MDPTRFDALTRTLARRLSRRDALGRLAQGGLTLPLLGALAPSVAAAQATPPAGPTPAPARPYGAPFCAVGFTATVRQGPDAGLTLHGTLAVNIAADGTLQGQVLVPTGSVATPSPGGTPTPPAVTRVAVVGQTSGRAINLLLTPPDGSPLFGVGTLEHDLAQCQGAMGGPFVGPRAADAGDWLASSGGCLGGCNSSYVRCYRGLSAAEADGAPGELCDAEFGSCSTYCSLSQ